jgi:molybdate transport system substrate-binding protein
MQLRARSPAYTAQMITRLLLTLALLLAAGPGHAQTLTLLIATDMKEVVVALVPGFQNKTGVRLRVMEGSAEVLLQRVQAGEAFDLLVLPTAALEVLATAGRVQRASITPLGRKGEAFGHARGPSGPLDDAAEVFVNSLNGYTATEVMKYLGIEPLR